MGRRDVGSNHCFLLVDLLVKLHHLLHVLSVENELWALTTLVTGLLGDGHWEAIGNVNHLSIDCTQQSSDDDRGVVAIHLLLLGVLQKVGHDLGLNNAMPLFGSAHTKIQIGFDLVLVFHNGDAGCRLL
jgi:hypothetical protein